MGTANILFVLSILVGFAGCYPLAPSAGPPAGMSADPGRSRRDIFGADLTPGTAQMPRWQREFGYFSVGVVGYSDFFGEIEGVGPGRGVTFTVPPLWPLSYALTLGAASAITAPVAFLETQGGGSGEATVAVFGGAFDTVGRELLDREKLHHGIIDPSRQYISDFSVDLTYSFSQHTDDTFGGRVDRESVLLGARFGGPRRYRPRYYLVGGVGWYWLDFDGRPDADLFGPYGGAGLEGFFSSEGTLGVEYRAQFYFGDDDAGQPVKGGAHQIAVVSSWYW